ncbi:hypothetical protein SEA_ENYGMA_181 [Streptomyces phage Enygma]
MPERFVKDLGEARDEEHAWAICVRLRTNMKGRELTQFKRRNYFFRAHKINGKWHACLFEKL